MKNLSELSIVVICITLIVIFKITAGAYVTVNGTFDQAVGSCIAAHPENKGN